MKNQPPDALERSREIIESIRFLDSELMKIIDVQLLQSAETPAPYFNELANLVGDFDEETSAIFVLFLARRLRNESSFATEENTANEKADYSALGSPPSR